MKKEVFSKSVALLIKEMFLILAIRIVMLIKDFFAVVVNQTAGELEIQRLNKDVPLAVSEFVINHQISFTTIFGIFIFLLFVMAIFVLVKDGMKIINIIRKGEKA